MRKIVVHGELDHFGIDQKELYVGSPELINHQKHPGGERLIREYMEETYPVPPKDSLGDYIYLSQLTQAYGIKTAIEAHRRAMPYCMGSLYWQLNDCWPVISWSSLDYYDRWKALHYFAKRAFKDILASPVKEKNNLKIFLVNDLMQDREGRIFVLLKDFEGHTIYADSSDIIAISNNSVKTFTKDLNNLLRGKDPSTHFLEVLFLSGEDTLASSEWYFSRPLDLRLPEPDIKAHVDLKGEWVYIHLNSNDLVKDLYLEFKNYRGKFSDNFFDLIPGEKRTIIFYPDDKDKIPGQKDLDMTHLAQILKKYHP